MDAILLRTLTEKSILWFGKFNGVAVGDIIKLNEIGYLRFVYFCIAGVSFNDSVLARLDIKTDAHDYTIKKPGTDPIKYSELQGIKEKLRSGLNDLIVKGKQKARGKAKFHTFKIRDRKEFSKGNLTRINHGH